jgi:hypothetical protein
VSVSYESLSRFAEENAALPKNQSGHIVSPKYVPLGSSYLSEWRFYCKQTPKAQWPPWLAADVAMMRRSK